jgi:hypothetical protein
MIADKREFGMGVVLLLAFVAVFIGMFMPWLNGRNTLNYMDDLYNSISKDSAYYVPGLQASVDPFAGQTVEATLTYVNERRAEQAALLFRKAGAEVIGAGGRIEVVGDLGALLAAALADTDAMFHNDADELESRYGYPGRQALYNWWASLNELDRALKNQKRFDAAQFVDQVNKKGVECAYNYFGIEPESIGDKAWIVLLSLVFYVIYTLWFGYSILFLFEGWGLNLSH